LKAPPNEIVDEIDVSRELDGSNRSRDLREGSRNVATSSHAYISSIHPSALHVMTRRISFGPGLFLC